MDKSDPAPDPALWQSLERLARLQPVGVASAPQRAPSSRLSQRVRDRLFQENIREINALDIDSGSLVKTFLMELERRKVFIQLRDAAPQGHAIGYHVLQGDPSVFGRLARALGLLTTADGRLEVRHA